MQTQAQIKFGAKAGLNGNTMSLTFDDSDQEIATKLLFAYHFGATAEIQFSDVLSLQTGLLFTSKGSKYDLEDVFAEELEYIPGLEISGYMKMVLNYVEVPLNIAYKFGDFQVFAGPYIAVGIGGKSKSDITYEFGGDSESESEEYKYKPVFGEVEDDDLADDENAFSALDYGVNIGIGYQVGPVLINAGYSLGFGNILPAYEGDDDYRKDNKMSNRVISLSATYYFGL